MVLRYLGRITAKQQRFSQPRGASVTSVEENDRRMAVLNNNPPGSRKISRPTVGISGCVHGKLLAKMQVSRAQLK